MGPVSVTDEMTRPVQSLYRCICRQTVKDESQRSISLANHANIQEHVSHCLRRSEVNPRTAICPVHNHKNIELYVGKSYLFLMSKISQVIDNVHPPRAKMQKRPSAWIREGSSRETSETVTWSLPRRVSVDVGAGVGFRR